MSRVLDGLQAVSDLPEKVKAGITLGLGATALALAGAVYTQVEEALAPEFPEVVDVTGLVHLHETAKNLAEVPTEEGACADYSTASQNNFCDFDQLEQWAPERAASIEAMGFEDRSTHETEFSWDGQRLKPGTTVCFEVPEEGDVWCYDGRKRDMVTFSVDRALFPDTYVTVKMNPLTEAGYSYLSEGAHVGKAYSPQYEASLGNFR